MSRQLNQITKDIEETTKLAIMDLETAPAKTRAGLYIAKADSEKRLKELQEEYKTQLGPRVATIFVTGDRGGQEAFAKLSAAEGETLTVDAAAMYARMALDVEPTIGASRQFGGTQLNHLVRSLEEVGRTAGVSLLPVPHLLEVLTAKTMYNTMLIIQDLIRTQVGDALNCRYIERQILDAALKSRYGEKVVPVVVLSALTASENAVLQPNVFGGIGITVKLAVDTKIDQDLVRKVFEELREYLKTARK